MGHQEQAVIMPTWVARLTPAGSSALATLALHGPDAIRIAQQHFSKSLDPTHDPRPHYGVFGSDVTDDIVLTVLNRDPGDVEICCHGGPAMVDALIAQLIDAGAIEVGWRELATAREESPLAIEILAALACCTTARTAQILLDQHDGRLEAAFSQIELGDRDLAQRLLQWAQFGTRLTKPWTVVLFGRPNVGKSSLLNAIAGFPRAIVSEIAGATRDVLGVDLAVDGWPIHLLDGAGLRDSSEPIEAIGERHLQRQLTDADLRILILDLSQPPHDDDLPLRERYQPHLIFGNKSDLPSPWPLSALPPLDAQVSAETGAGITHALQTIIAKLIPILPEPDAAIPICDRQIEWLKSYA